MKKLILIFALVAFTAVSAQEIEDKKKETVITKTTVQDSDGKEVAAKAVTKTTNQVITVEGTGELNQSTIMTPTNVNTDVSYSNAGTNYTFEAEKLGFRMLNTNNDDGEIFAVLRPSSQKGYYVISQNGNNSFGYFNQDGNFVVDSYDTKTDAVITTIYLLKLDNPNSIQQKKM